MISFCGTLHCSYPRGGRAGKQLFNAQRDASIVAQPATLSGWLDRLVRLAVTGAAVGDRPSRQGQSRIVTRCFIEIYKSGIVMMDTYWGQAHPWLCDVMGHLNTRNIVAMFDDANMHFLSRLSGSSSTIIRGDLGWVDAKVTLELKKEIPLGNLVRIRTGIAGLGTKSLTSRSIMSDLTGENVHAIADTVTVAFNFKTRQSVALGPDIRKEAEQYFIANSLG